ncbi:ATP-binding protein [Variovorax dokdonensis]|uniref:histidine kinase n=1 Tax=Variovorax dokdonensis TaxID=344883 RepID=A0ABT7NDK8_9BURK|nr:ATP-binding protein [Variovorax dokdonensis]MDM0046013.1 ATP-binding protein [Variovorax dokdonensis]
MAHSVAGRSKPQSLASRLTRSLILWVAGVWLLVVLAVVWYVDSEINHNFDSELVEVTHRLFDIAVNELDEAGDLSGKHLPILAKRPLFPQDEVVFQLIDGQGRLLMHSEKAPAMGFDVPNSQGFADTGPWRVYTARHPERDLFMRVADPLEERREALNRTLFGLILVLVAVLPILALLLRGVARQELHPLEWLANQIGQRSGSDLRPIALPALPRELLAVGDDVNRLLDRLAQALDVERALAANAAHELRTPLASARLRLQTALDHGLQREEVQAALDALRVLSNRAEKLLQLSRAESGATLTREPVDLPQLAAQLAQEYWRDAQTLQRLHLVVPDDESLHPALGDVDSLAIALRNLIENALRYSDTRVVVELVAPSTLVVRDDGPGVDPAHLQSLARRHVRQSSDRAGYGLGLSIVSTIAARHGGRLELYSPPPGRPRGFEARLVLPNAS